MRISYREAKWLYENDCEVRVYYRILSTDKTAFNYHSALLFRPIFSAPTLDEAMKVLVKKHNIESIIAYESDKHPVDMMKTKLNSQYGRSCTMKMTHERFTAVEEAVTLVKCLRKGMLEPNEPLVLAACQDIERQYKEGHIDRGLMVEIADKLSDLKCQYAFDI